MAVMAATRIVAPNGWGWLADHTGRDLFLIRLACLLTFLGFGLDLRAAGLLGAVRRGGAVGFLLECLPAHPGVAESGFAQGRCPGLQPDPAVGFGRVHPGRARRGRGARSAACDRLSAAGAGLSVRADGAVQSRHSGRRAGDTRACPGYLVAGRQAARGHRPVAHLFADSDGPRPLLQLLFRTSGEPRLRPLPHRPVLGLGGLVGDRPVPGPASDPGQDFTASHPAREHRFDGLALAADRALRRSAGNPGVRPDAACRQLRRVSRRLDRPGAPLFPGTQPQSRPGAVHQPELWCGRCAGKFRQRLRLGRFRRRDGLCRRCGRILHRPDHRLAAGGSAALVFGCCGSTSQSATGPGTMRNDGCGSGRFSVSMGSSQAGELAVRGRHWGRYRAGGDLARVEAVASALGFGVDGPQVVRDRRCGVGHCPEPAQLGMMAGMQGPKPHDRTRLNPAAAAGRSAPRRPSLPPSRRRRPSGAACRRRPAEWRRGCNRRPRTGSDGSPAECGH
ncbi:hypothetical protein [Plasmodium yoelii yoelii]|uniref:Uncharacterized protein n=1 Tax=Plasmodium yoelii yoelii TaxID=73239 RepID=Q7R714_PLAYO|nr:hypothetical protein [Plasmodium yoelii yoelii]